MKTDEEKFLKLYAPGAYLMKGKEEDFVIDRIIGHISSEENGVKKLYMQVYKDVFSLKPEIATEAACDVISNSRLISQEELAAIALKHYETFLSAEVAEIHSKSDTKVKQKRK